MRAILLTLAPVLLAAASPTPAAGTGNPASAQTELQTAVERHGHLRVEGNRIVDEHGDPVVLRGMSLFWSQWKPQFYNDATICWLRDDWNVDIVRAAMAVDYGGYIAHPQREMKKIETVIDAAIRDGIYVIVDWHAHRPAAKEASVFFAAIARKYGAYPNIIYETWNEPLRDQDWGTVIKPYHMAVIPKIRAIDPDNLIIAGTQTWSQDVDKAAADRLPFSNLAYTLHFYAGTHRQELRDKAAAALKAGVALMVTEWGTSDATGAGVFDQKETRIWWDFLEKNHLSYVNWSVADKVETSAALKPGASGQGGWPDRMISPSGLMVRARLRAMNPKAPHSC